MPPRLEFEYRFRRASNAPALRPGGDQSMNILLLGDFSGRAGRPADAAAGDRRNALTDLRARLPVALDVDNFERVMRGMAPSLHLTPEAPTGSAKAVEFRQIEDFHPDALYRRLELFQPFREMRRRVLDGDLSLVRDLLPSADSPGDPAATPLGPPIAPADRVAPEDDRVMFERLLGRPALHPAGPRVDLTALLKEVVGPYVKPSPDPRQSELLAAVDLASSAAMRALLHRPDLQALEGRWRGVHRLATVLETGDRLRLYLLDATPEEVERDLQEAGEDLERCAIFGLIVDDGAGGPGGAKWSLWSVDLAFGARPQSLKTLAALGAVASQAGAPLLAAADPALLGCGAFDRIQDPRDWVVDAGLDHAWQAVRCSPAASWVGLSLPRVLLRLPYGHRTDPIDSFAFEEVGAHPEHGTFLWGNPAFACVGLLGRAFQEAGWAMTPNDCLDLDDLPAHTRLEAGEPRMTPCAETWLTDRAVEAILDRGLMPLVSRRDAHAVRLPRIQSIADPLSTLSGPWR